MTKGDQVINTHLEINKTLCGEVTSQSKGEATVEMTTTKEMESDSRGLVHGGFIFGMADYAAMVAVNDPNVVLGAAETSFLKPSKVGDILTATATVESEKGKKCIVHVKVVSKNTTIFSGTFTCFVLDEHVFDM